MQDFNDKVAFVTGAASGIGLGMAKAFVDVGMKVVITDIRKAALEFRARLIRRKGGRCPGDRTRRN